MTQDSEPEISGEEAEALRDEIEAAGLQTRAAKAAAQEALAARDRAERLASCYGAILHSSRDCLVITSYSIHYTKLYEASPWRTS